MPTHWKPADKPTLTAALPGGAALIDLATQAFGATVQSRYDLPDGGVAHAELRFGDALLMTGDDAGEHVLSPGQIMVYVPDVDEAFQRALACGATAKEAPADQFYGDRVAVVMDRNGNRWTLATHLEDLTEEDMERRVQDWMEAHPGEG